MTAVVMSAALAAGCQKAEPVETTAAAEDAEAKETEASEAPAAGGIAKEDLKPSVSICIWTRLKKSGI